MMLDEEIKYFPPIQKVFKNCQYCGELVERDIKNKHQPATCPTCRKKIQTEWRIKNVDKIRARNKAFYWKQKKLKGGEEV